MQQICDAELYLFRRARSLGLSKEDREDIVQETLLRACRASAAFDTRKPLIPWMWAILLNIHRDNLRRQRSAPRPLSLDALIRLPHPQSTVNNRQSQMGFDREDPAAGPEQSYLDSGLSPIMVAALGRLHPLCRRTIIYADILQMSYREIAALMQTPEGTVRSRLHRGRARLRVAFLSETQREEIRTARQGKGDGR